MDVETGDTIVETHSVRTERGENKVEVWNRALRSALPATLLLAETEGLQRMLEELDEKYQCTLSLEREKVYAKLFADSSRTLTTHDSLAQFGVKPGSDLRQSTATVSDVKVQPS
jgi:hypothetical protein